MRGRIKKLASFHHHLHPQEGITLSFLHMSPKSVHRYHCPHHLSKDSCVEKIPWRRDRLPTPLFLGFPGGSAGKESACKAGDPNLISGPGRSPAEGVGYPLQYSFASLVAQLVKNLPAMWEPWVLFLGWQDPLDQGKATQSSILDWRIPCTV